MGWNISILQLTDAALDFASTESIVQKVDGTCRGHLTDESTGPTPLVYGRDGILAGFHNRSFDSSEDMSIALAENMGGGVLPTCCGQSSGARVKLKASQVGRTGGGGSAGS